MTPPINIKDIPFHISEQTHNLKCELEKLVQIQYKLVHPNSYLLGQGEFVPNSSFKKVEIKINSSFQQYSDIIISHEIIHLLMAFQRGFAFIFNKESSQFMGGILSAFEHPSIINIQNELKITDHEFIKRDFTHNLKQLTIFNSKPLKQTENYINHSITWADRSNWGIDNIEIREALLIVKQFRHDIFDIFKAAKKNIAFYTKEPNGKNLLLAVHKIYSMVGMDKAYRIQRIN